MKKQLALFMFVLGYVGMAYSADARKYTAAKPHGHIGFIWPTDLSDQGKSSSAMAAFKRSDFLDEDIFPVKYNFNDERGCKQFILGRNVRVSYYPASGKIEVKGLDPQKLSNANFIRALVAVEYFDLNARSLSS